MSNTNTDALTNDTSEPFRLIDGIGKSADEFNRAIIEFAITLGFGPDEDDDEAEPLYDMSKPYSQRIRDVAFDAVQWLNKLRFSVEEDHVSGIKTLCVGLRKGAL